MENPEGIVAPVADREKSPGSVQDGPVADGVPGALKRCLSPNSVGPSSSMASPEPLLAYDTSSELADKVVCAVMNGTGTVHDVSDSEASDNVSRASVTDSTAAADGGTISETRSIDATEVTIGEPDSMVTEPSTAEQVGDTMSLDRSPSPQTVRSYPDGPCDPRMPVPVPPGSPGMTSSSPSIHEASPEGLLAATRFWEGVFSLLDDANDLLALLSTCRELFRVYKLRQDDYWALVLARMPWRIAPRKDRWAPREFYRDKSREVTNNWRTGACTFTSLWGHNGWVMSLMFDHRLLVSGSMDKRIKLWDIHGTRACMRTLEGHMNFVSAVRLGARDIVSGSADQTVRQWDLESGQCLRMVELEHQTDQQCPVYDLKLGPASQVVVGCHDGSIRLLDLNSPRYQVGHLSEHTAAVTCVAWDGANTIISTSSDKTARVWDRRMMRSLLMFTKHRKAVTALHWSGPGSPVITGSYDKSIRQWNPDTGSLTARKYIGHTEAVTAVQAKGKRLVTGSNDRTVRLWSLKTHRCVQVFGGCSGDVFCLQFDRNIIVNGSARTINVWDFEARDV